MPTFLKSLICLVSVGAAYKEQAPVGTWRWFFVVVSSVLAFLFFVGDLKGYRDCINEDGGGIFACFGHEYSDVVNSDKSDAAIESELLESDEVQENTIEPPLSDVEFVLAQEALAELGHEPGAIDGVFGGASRKALARWQITKGKSGTGHFASRMEWHELYGDYKRQEKLKELTDPSIQESRDHKPGEQFQDCTKCPAVVMLPSGKFVFGSSGHEIRLRKSFAIAKYETTFDEYDRFVDAIALTHS